MRLRILFLLLVSLASICSVLMGFVVPGNADFTLFLKPSNFTRELVGFEDFPPMLIFGKMTFSNQNPAELFAEYRDGKELTSILLEAKGLPFGLVVDGGYPLEKLVDLIERFTWKKFGPVTGNVVEISKTEREVLFPNTSVSIFWHNQFWFVCFSQVTRQMVVDMLARKVPAVKVNVAKNAVLHYRNLKFPVANMALYLIGEFWGKPSSEELIATYNDVEGRLEFELTLGRVMDPYEKASISKFEPSLRGLTYLENAQYIFGGVGTFANLFAELMRFHIVENLGFESILRYFANYLVSVRFDPETEEFIWRFSGKYLPESENIIKILFTERYNAFRNVEVNYSERTVSFTSRNLEPETVVQRYGASDIAKLYLNDGEVIADIAVERLADGSLKVYGTIPNRHKFFELLSKLWERPREELEEEWIPEEPEEGEIPVDEHTVWAFETDGEIWSSAAVGPDGTIYFGSDDGALYALTPDGELKWKFQTGSHVESSPAIGLDGTIYFGSYDDFVYALYPDGTLKWKFETGGDVDSSPAIDWDGTVYIGSLDGCLYALTPDGELKWRFETDDAVLSSPAVGPDGTIYFGSYDGYFYALTREGELLWKYRTDGKIYSSPAIGPHGVIYVGSHDGKVYAFTPDGEVLWVFKTDGSIESSPAIGADGTVYIGSGDNRLYAIDPDGSLKWSFETGDDVDSTPFVSADGTIYFGSWDGYLYALNPDGSLLWKMRIGAGIWTSPAVGIPDVETDTIIYIGSMNGRFYAIQNPNGRITPADSPWPKFRRDFFNTGSFPAY